MDNVDLGKVKDILQKNLYPPQDSDEESILYAIIDGASMDDIEHILPTRTQNFHSLFYRHETNEFFLDEGAPYLIAIEDDDTLMTWLLDEFYGDGAISFYYSKAPLEELAIHLSHYPVIWVDATDDHKAGEAYLGFYDPRVMPGFLRGLGASMEAFFAPLDKIICEIEEDNHLLVSWHLDDNNECLESLIDSNTTDMHTQMLTRHGEDGIDESHSPIKLTPAMMNALDNHELNRNTNIMAKRLKALFKDDFADVSIGEMRSKVYQSIRRMRSYGFDSYPNLFSLAAWELYYGHGYEHQDPSGELDRICKSTLSEDQKFVYFKQRVEQIDFNEVQRPVQPIAPTQPKAQGTAHGQ